MSEPHQGQMQPVAGSITAADDLTVMESRELARREELLARARREAADWMDTARIIEKEARDFGTSIVAKRGLDTRNQYRFDPEGGRIILVAAWTPVEADEPSNGGTS